MLTLKILVLFAYFAISSCRLTFTVNPNCSSDCDKPWLIHGLKSTAKKEFHYLWNAVPHPTFITAVTHPNSTLKVHWDDLINMEVDSIKFEPPPLYLFALSFQKLILFNDKNDTGELDGIPPSDIRTADLSDFAWSLYEVKNESTGDWSFGFKSISYKGEELAVNREVSFLITSFVSFGRSTRMPRLLTTPTSSQIKIVLKNLTINNSYLRWNKDEASSGDPKAIPIGGFDCPRWALDAILLSKRDRNLTHETLNFSSYKSLDDEYSPGVFDLNDIVVTSNSSQPKSFMQWRPISYLTPEDDINFSTCPSLNTSFPPIDEEHCNISHKSLINVIFGPNLSSYLGTQTTIAFGRPKDGFYTKYNYTEWTLSFGIGAPPSEGFSLLVIIIILVGLGLPFLCFIGGAIAVFIIRKRRRYTLLQES